MAMATRTAARHAVLSLTTKFRLPHEGMTEMEYLSRGSAFLLDTTGRAGSPRVRDLTVLTCQHVACPWLFPQYFAGKWHWLQHVSEEFVEHSLQLLALPPVNCAEHSQSHSQPQTKTPTVLAEIPLQRHVRLHASRDVALLSLSDSLAELEWDRYAGTKWGLELLTLPARSGDAMSATAAGDVLLFTGHKQLGATGTAAAADDDDGDDVGQFPHEVLGRFVGQSSQGQAFAWSEEVLEEGMCGGAVVNTQGDCIGLIEGIVPPFVESAEQSSEDAGEGEDPATVMRKALANHVAFIPAAELASFVDERGPVLATGTLLGAGDADDDNELW